MSARRTAVVAAALAILLSTAAAPAAAGGHVEAVEPQTDEPGTSEQTTAAADEIRIVALLANPAADGDAGEYVVVSVPEPTNLSGWTLGDDGQDLAHLPEKTVEGTVAISVDPGAAGNLTDREAHALSGRLRLANGGDRVELRRNGSVVDAVAYDSAPEAELWRRSRRGATAERGTDDAPAAGNWTPLGATDFEASAIGVDAVTAFALPDAPETPVQRIERADERILLAGYTFADERVARALVDAHERGVRVEVLVEGSPVGGVTTVQARVLDDLSAAGVEVRALGGEATRYRFHHPKYAVVDDEALVMTENWKPAGTGGKSSRGWGVVVHDAAVAAQLRAVFDADAGWRAAAPWDQYRKHVDPVATNQSEGRYPDRFDTERMEADSVRVLTAPDNAEAELRDLIADADDSVLITQVSIGGRENPLLQETLDAARRGVEVRILLSSAWYAEERNRKLATWLERLAAEEELDLRVKLADPRGRYEKIHAKGVVIDEERAVVGSVNWNVNSLRENREVAVVIEGREPGRYYAALFRADWRGGVERLPIGLACTLVAAVAGCGAVARRRVRFENESGAAG